jgi:U3 small nucleolar RNA-associated protein 10
VLEALYANHTALLPLVLNDPVAFIQTLSQVLHGRSPLPNRHVVKAHISFIAMRLYPNIAALSDGPKLTRMIFEQIVFPYLLFSKPRQKTASLVWEVIEATEKSTQGDLTLARFELLGGCVDALRWEQAQQKKATAQGDDSYQVTESLAKSNITVAGKIAGKY